MDDSDAPIARIWRARRPIGLAISAHGEGAVAASIGVDRAYLDAAFAAIDRGQNRSVA